MTSLTFSADEDLLDQAQAYAASHGTTLNQLVTDYLRQIAQGMSRSEAANEFARLARLHPVRPEEGWQFNREDIHRRGEPT